MTYKGKRNIGCHLASPNWQKTQETQVNHFQDTQENKVGQRIYIQSNYPLNDKFTENRFKHMEFRECCIPEIFLKNITWINSRVTGDPLFKGLIAIRCLKGAPCSCLFLVFWDQDLVQGSKLRIQAGIKGSWVTWNVSQNMDRQRNQIQAAMIPHS